jgi:short-subunit dehydrogenase
MQKTALITGASSGIGRELAVVHAENGHPVILVARSENKLDELKLELEDRYNARVLIISEDLNRQKAAKNVYDQVQDAGWQVHILINNAGIGDVAHFAEESWDKITSMINVNIRALTYLTRLFVPEMIQRGSGRVMNVSSTAAFQPGPMLNIYYATKHYVQAFSRALAYELKNTGVTVTALCPGPTESNFHSRARTEGTKLVSTSNIHTSRQVAEYGYKAMMKGKQVAIPGKINKVRRFVSWAVPITLLLAFVYNKHQQE